MKKFFKEFRDFAIGGNLIDLAVGVIIGGAFNKIVGSLVGDIFVPVLGLIFGNPEGLETMEYKGIMYGNFLTAVITFILTAFCLFIFIKAINKAKSVINKPEEKPAEPEAPAAPTTEELLGEIKDLLAKMAK